MAAHRPARRHLADRHGFELTDAWLDHAMKASVRFTNGGSGGFVSPDGLVVTNHHIAADSIQKLSAADRDLMRDGFLAARRADELKCPDLELNVLQSIEDVTARVNAAVKPDASPAEAAAARRAVLSAIEKESLDRTGLRSDVVTLYNGGLYHLYRYKKYTDVRLVFAPEKAIASFGGDVDNFEYPRYDLDVAFVRVYENDRPAKIDHYFPWSGCGPKENDLVFVLGHPGTTNRLETYETLIHRRDRSHPYSLRRLRMLEAALTQYAAGSPESARRGANDLYRVANARKALSGQYQGLLDAGILAVKREQERPLREADPEPFRQIEAARRALAEFEVEFSLLEGAAAFGGELFSAARHLVRLAEELEKPNGDRLREYRDSNLESLRLQLFSPAPIYPDLERAKLAATLTFLAEELGGDHPRVRGVLEGRPPAVRAAELVAGCRLADVAERRRLADGGVLAIVSSEDAMIRLARGVDKFARELRSRHETTVEEPERQAYARIAELRFAKFGRDVAPDATFTLRLAFGSVKGYRDGDEVIPYATTAEGLYRRHELMLGREPFELPRRWLDGRALLAADLPINFAATSDTIGGNSGSPVVNRAGELVGVNFDRNRPGLVRNFVYTEEQARHVSVHSRGILEVLRKLYRAEALAAELTGR